jgi:putative N6-adenine-specific DNA methylase
MNETLFYLIISPGLTGIASEELKVKSKLYNFNYKIINSDHGGIELQMEFSEGLRLNYLLKIPTRILWRLGTFTASNVPTMLKKMQEISWEKFLFSTTSLNFKVTAKTSRLYHRELIEETALKAINKYLKGQPPTKNTLNLQTSPTVFMRLEDDVCTVSIDTSGEALYKRGLKTKNTEAPLRENFAAAILFAIKKTENLLDPMCGSGTFLLEAKTFFTPVTTRPFDFESFPQYLKIKSRLKKFPAVSETLFNTVLGSDISGKNILAAKENLATIASDVALVDKDFFKEKSLPGDSTLVMNPPFDVRINYKKQQNTFLVELHEKILELAPKQAVLILPDAQSHFLQNHDSHWRKIFGFSHGGLKVQVISYISTT